jgi:hypothetical protein
VRGLQDRFPNAAAGRWRRRLRATRRQGGGFAMPRRKVSIFRSTFAAPRSSGGYGKPFAASRRIDREHIARSLGGSERRRRCARWRRRVRRTRSRLPFRVIGWCARTDSSRATAGALHANAPAGAGGEGMSRALTAERERGTRGLRRARRPAGSRRSIGHALPATWMRMVAPRPDPC